MHGMNVRPSSQALIISSLDRQKRYGPYSTSLLSLLVLASVCENGLLKRKDSRGQGFKGSREIMEGMTGMVE